VDTHAAFVTRVPRVAPYMKLNNTPSPRVVGTGGSGAVLSVINIGVRIATRSLAQSYLRYVGESRGHSARSRERSPCFAVFRCARTSPDVRSSHPHRAAFIVISAIRHRYILPSVILNLLPRCLRERRRSPRIIRVRINDDLRHRFAIVAKLVQLTLSTTVRNVLFYAIGKFEVLRNFVKKKLNTIAIFKFLINFFGTRPLCVCVKINNC